MGKKIKSTISNHRSIIKIIVLFLFVNYGCNLEQVETINYQEKYANVIDIKIVPQHPYKLDAFGFSDKGAWHGYSLPCPDSSSYLGGFCGPLLMKMHGQWLGKSIARLRLLDENGTLLPFKKRKFGKIIIPDG